MKLIDKYFLEKEEPVKSCLLFLREYILNYDDAITEDRKYGMPFYLYNGKMCCYLWVHKKYGIPYIGVVEGNKIKHDRLLSEKRARMKIVLIEPNEDVDINMIDAILSQIVALYKK
ncbi:hypothetical protein GCM10007424_06050 [Flavobacterium suaedae]|uniref:YdhG-like domain-containing protein n=1 Tax=Flavobacterium suaedae TaxID=1767027 RepID=A0ABQ1JHW3_9FLAO|nr:DUF1801 domain-containing protein [Flavobacterium suaedae]GGB68830.1 hypothetical protein GCM10007424_06050 [Flavobacterium suaedae]